MTTILRFYCSQSIREYTMWAHVQRHYILKDLLGLGMIRTMVFELARSRVERPTNLRQSLDLVLDPEEGL